MTDVTKNRLKSFVNATMRGCTIAVAVLISFFVVMAIMTAKNDMTEQGMNLSSMLTLTAFSLVIAYAQEIFKISAIPTPARWIINYLVCGVAFFFVVLRSSMLIATSSSFYVAGMLIYTLIYGVIALVSLLMHRLVRRKAKDGETPGEGYTSRFE